jgi:hypothetical protein
MISILKPSSRFEGTGPFVLDSALIQHEALLPHWPAFLVLPVLCGLARVERSTRQFSCRYLETQVSFTRRVASSPASG